MTELASKIGVLRDIRWNELEMMLSWRNAPSVRQNMYTQHEISLSEHLAWWKQVQNRSDQLYFMYEANQIPCGIVAFNEINRFNKNSSWAFYAAPNAPKGTGSKMEYLVLEKAFNQIQVRKLNCEVLAFNRSVIKLHEKFGFKIEGIMREHHKVRDVFVDVYRLGIFDHEWQMKRDQIFNILSR
jgi:UDP-4-amino-4,6-dideoxy-N-acetyl-beta-L-altrosamine N-acetyltransferase